MFELKNVKYKNILDINNLKIKKGKLTCIVGESGSGKTTLLRLLNKMISKTNGTITYDGINVDDIDSIDLRRKVVMLPQTPPIFDGTVKDNLLIGLVFSESDLVSDEILSNVLNKVNLNIDLGKDVGKLSGGEKQRLSLARVMLLDREVYLLDEPSSALDKNTEDIIFKNITNHVKENNKTLIMITHSTDVALKYSDETIKISNGKIIK